ncbi:MAG: sigma-70 family RNA polymerase sigma factor [Elusimicrobia bacterium]|nr:sigma-70 family RNA polymerase sigma factor [Elusimicrobiota bacterium]
MNEARPQEFKSKALPLLDEMYGVALRMTRHPQVAEDLVAEAFARGWKSLEQFQPGTNLRAWLYRIMTNAYINDFRKKNREPEKVSVDAYEKLDEFHLYNRLSTEAPAAPDPVRDVIARLTNDDFRTALDALPEEFRTAIVLYDLQGLSYDDVAKALDVPIGTVRSRLARGRRQLQAALYRHAVDAGLVGAQR